MENLSSPYMDLWYGKIPTFIPTPEVNCKNDYFNLRITSDTRYYLHTLYANSKKYNLNLISRAMESVARCHRAENAIGEERSRILQNKLIFELGNDKKLPDQENYNDVWRYRDPPTS